MKQYNFFVYIVTNKKNGTLYTGVTNSLERRIYEHKHKKINSFTKQYKCKKLVWYEHHFHVDDAIRREKKIKRWRRKWKLDLIEKMNPEWKDKILKSNIVSKLYILIIRINGFAQNTNEFIIFPFTIIVNDSRFII